MWLGFIGHVSGNLHMQHIGRKQVIDCHYRYKGLFVECAVSNTLWALHDEVGDLLGDSRPPYGCLGSETASYDSLVTFMQLLQSLHLKSFGYHNPVSKHEHPISHC